MAYLDPERSRLGPASTMNYSPRHSRKPSLLSTLRNINMKQLLLNLSSPPQPVSDPVQLPLRNGLKKPPALSIPPGLASALITPVVALTPLIPPAPPPQKTSVASLRLLPVMPLSEFSLGDSPPHFEPSSPDIALLSPFGLQGGLADNVNDRIMPATTKEPFLPPEELQEQSNLDAYPFGPARVLDTTLFLYLDPKNSKCPVDINDYELVVNVARDCDDLLAEYDDRDGRRTYLHVPWSHTSLILKELLNITSTIARYDKPNSRILVHCQCGVLRSACVVVAYFMVKFDLLVNEAYELLKSGTANTAEPCNWRIAREGHHVDACERICPNMSLIFELMDFDDLRKAKDTTE